MKNEKLSPDELDSLLGRAKKEVAASSTDVTSLTAGEYEMLTELFSVSLGSSSHSLSTLFGDQVLITSPELSVKGTGELFQGGPVPFIIALSEYVGGIAGIQLLAVDQSDGRAMAEMISGDTENQEDQFIAVQSVVQEVFNAVARSLSALLEQEVNHSLSGVDIVEEQADFQAAQFTQEEWFTEIVFQLKVGNRQDLSIQFYIPVRLAKQLVELLDDSPEEDDQEEKQEMTFQKDNPSKESAPQHRTGSSPNIQSVQFSSFDEETPSQSEPNNLNMLLDIPLQVTVELGRTKRMVKEILAISQGSILELDKLAGEPVDILVNNKLIAVGEVVVIDENFGVRVTDILSAADRISKLR